MGEEETKLFIENLFPDLFGYMEQVHLPSEFSPDTVLDIEESESDEEDQDEDRDKSDFKRLKIPIAHSHPWVLCNKSRSRMTVTGRVPTGELLKLLRTRSMPSGSKYTLYIGASHTFLLTFTKYILVCQLPESRLISRAI